MRHTRQGLKPSVLISRTISPILSILNDASGDNLEDLSEAAG
ncbi:MAG TPA: hypothetical protein VN776_15780 [Terracidiphilus sp.]|nr:hypothetical protein [Terracidiphilus sp.]